MPSVRSKYMTDTEILKSACFEVKERIDREYIERLDALPNIYLNEADKKSMIKFLSKIEKKSNTVIKRKTVKIILIAAILILLLLTSALCFADSQYFDIASKYSKMSEDKILKELKSMSFDEISEEINGIDENEVDYSELLYHENILAEKAKKLSSNELVNIISDENNSNYLRAICIQIIDHNGNNLTTDEVDKLISILLNEDEADIIRENIIWILPENMGVALKIEPLIDKENDSVAMQVLKKINTIDSEYASNIAKSLAEDEINNKKGLAAIKVITADFDKIKNKEEKDDWVKFCIDIIENSENKKDDPDFEKFETMVFALAEMNYKDALYYIIESEKIENFYKTYAITENYELIKNILADNPTTEDLNMAKKAMDYAPNEEINILIKK